MERVGRIKELRQRISNARAAGKSVGLVPTMGALHEGHLSLVRTAREETGFVVVTIFVNPTQFGPGEDLARYPRDIEGDCKKLQASRADLVFFPDAEVMYPPGFVTRVIPDREFTNRLCGASRPGHFEGVTTVVAKLFNLVRPDVAYFGAKDYQQSVVIRRMARDLDFDLDVRVLPTVREPDGLAMSSRNAYLNEKERRDALALYRALKAGAEVIAGGERRASAVRAVMRAAVDAVERVRTDYLEAVDAETLEERQELAGLVLLAGAVFVGKTRLIDNIVVSVPG